MIQANELRIGNWYSWYADGKNYYYQVEAKDFVSDNIKNFKPIPLTEEILLKCGFEKTDDYGDQIYYEPKNRGNRNYYICFDHEDISFGLNVFGNCTNLLHDNSNLQFLHQLQNLYFALTGEELTVNL